MESGLNGSFISNADHKLSNPKDRPYAEKDDADLKCFRGGSRIFFRRGCTTKEWRN